MPARTAIAVVVTLLSASVWTGAATPSIASRWKDRDIQVDGALRDWTELGAFEDAVSVAAVNDNRELYLAIATSDPQRQAQLIATGLVVWLDPDGGKKEKYGIRIPGSGMARRGNRSGGASSQGAPEAFRPRVTYVELLGPGNDDHRRIELTEQPTPALFVAAGLDTGTLVYEFRIPLQQPGSESSADALQVRADRPLGLGLKTPKVELPEGGQRGGGTGDFGGPRGGGMGGMGGGMGGGRGGGGMGGPARGEFNPPKELNRWTKLSLASAS